MDQILGFQKQKEYFTTAFSHSDGAHAYLLSGPKHIGKQAFILAFSEKISGRPWVTNPDIKIIAPQTTEGEASIYIEDSRKLKTFLSLTPVYGPLKITVIDNANRLTEEASNALLKVLEEPPQHSLLVLVTAHPSQLLPTIRSRCIEVRFQLHDQETVQRAIAGVKISKDDRELISFLAAGRIGWAITHATREHAAEIRGSIADFQKILKQGTFERMQYAKKLADLDTLDDHLDLWIRWIRAHGKDPQKTAGVLTKLLQLHTLVSQPQFNHRLALENFFISI